MSWHTKPFQPLPRRCATLTRSLPRINDKSNELRARHAFNLFGSISALIDGLEKKKSNSILPDVYAARDRVNSRTYVRMYSCQLVCARLSGETRILLIALFYVWCIDDHR